MYLRRRVNFLLCVAAVCVAFLTLTSNGYALDRFVTAANGRLMDGDKTFRFVSFNVPNLNYIEDDMRFTRTNPYRLPTEYEMRDMFATINEMGGQVVRIYTIPVKNDGFPPGAPTYVLAPGKFNETAFRNLDLMLALANEYGVRIIFPLVNNWEWMGGRPNYAAFRGKKPDEFWTDPQVIEDFKTTIRTVLERRNTITGVRYKDDKAILCWETGNELAAPFAWTVDIARFIKSLDHNHLVMDGGRGNAENAVPSVQPGALSEPAIDIVTTHHYESDVATIPGHIQDNIYAIKRRKVYIVGEFGFAPTAVNATLLNQVVAAKDDVAGALFWSLRFHDADGGFYWHFEPFGGGLYKALHWPGFPSGNAYDETGMMNLMRNKAFAIRGMSPPPVSAPHAPELLPIPSADAITWRGAMGATSYVVERAAKAGGPWRQIAADVSDADVPYFPLFNDSRVRIGAHYFYRVRAVNASGVSGPSNTVGPVFVAAKVKIDPMKDLSVASSSKAVEAAVGDDRRYKEIRNRLAGAGGSELVYTVPGRFEKLAVYDFEPAPSANLRIQISSNGKVWRDTQVAPQTFASNETNYDYWRPKLYESAAQKNVRFIKVLFTGMAQLARVVVAYTDH